MHEYYLYHDRFLSPHGKTAVNVIYTGEKYTHPHWSEMISTNSSCVSDKLVNFDIAPRTTQVYQAK